MNPPILACFNSHAVDRYPYFSTGAMHEEDHARLPTGDNKIWVRDEDDWLGITNQQDRRRIQNRRNQRALREETCPVAKLALMM